MRTLFSLLFVSLLTSAATEPGDYVALLTPRGRDCPLREMALFQIRTNGSVCGAIVDFKGATNALLTGWVQPRRRFVFEAIGISPGEGEAQPRYWAMSGVIYKAGRGTGRYWSDCNGTLTIWRENIR